MRNGSSMRHLSQCLNKWRARVCGTRGCSPQAESSRELPKVTSSGVQKRIGKTIEAELQKSKKEIDEWKKKVENSEELRKSGAKITAQFESYQDNP